MKYKTTYDLSHVTSLDALRREQIVVRQRIKDHEDLLRTKMYEIPAELAVAGANTLIPKMLRGKISNTVLNTGKKLINTFLVPENQQKQKLLTHTVKNKGVISLIQKGIGLFNSRK